jgi:hypothetical protein
MRVSFRSFCRPISTRSRSIWAALLACVAAPAAIAADAKTLTYSRDVAPILRRACEKCHRPGEAAPMSLQTFEEVRPWAKAIGKQVRTREMPPWDVLHGEDKWVNDPSLSDEEIAIVTGWVAAGAPEGNPADLPAAAVFSTGWTIGEPDLILTPVFPYEVPPDGNDRFEFVSLPTGLTEERWVSAVQVLPGDRKVVHHVMAYVEQEDEYSEEWGSRRGRRGNLMTEFAVGNSGDVFKEGTGKLLKPGSSIMLEIHYHPYGEPTIDRTQIGFKFHPKGAPARRVISKGISTRDLHIPAGEPSRRSEADYYLRQPAEIISFQPHMHCRGKSMDLEAILPDGTRQMLCSVPTFNFNWQITYTFKTPPLLPAGTTLYVTALHDNSASNPNNPDPTTDVWWGPQTTDEMMIGWTDIVFHDEEFTEPVIETAEIGSE